MIAPRPFALELDRLLRWPRTLPKLRPRQVTGRLLAPGLRRRALTATPRASDDPPPELWPAAAVESPRHFPWGVSFDGERMELTFLRETRRLDRSATWEAPEASLLWNFNLHYLQWLVPLSPAERNEAARGWVDGNPPAPGVAWRPYPLSLRISTLIRLDIRDAAVTRSLYSQAAFLHRCVEYHVMGNHLLENARALVLAGVAFRGLGEADEWLDHGLRIFAEELPVQVLADGGHEERSPMYHSQVLEGVLDAVNALDTRPDRENERTFLASHGRRMTAALRSWLMPDGRIPLLNDSTFEIATPPEQLVAYAERVLGPVDPAGDTFPESGYFIHRGARLHLFWDAGPGGPEHLMAHAHADVFSFELAVDGLRFVVDPGVYEYRPGPDRDAVRSTRAHSTVTVDGRDQLECWHSFRVARRSEPRSVLVERDRNRSVFSGEYPWAEVYGGDVVHRRELRVDDAAGRIRILDRVEGSGSHRIAANLPLHPDVILTRSADGFRLERGEAALDVRFEGGEVDVEERWVAPEFGLKIPNRALVLSREGSLPVEFVTELHVVG